MRQTKAELLKEKAAALRKSRAKASRAAKVAAEAIETTRVEHEEAERVAAEMEAALREDQRAEDERAEENRVAAALRRTEEARTWPAPPGYVEPEVEKGAWQQFKDWWFR